MAPSPSAMNAVVWLGPAGALTASPSVRAWAKRCMTQGSKAREPAWAAISAAATSPGKARAASATTCNRIAKDQGQRAEDADMAVAHGGELGCRIAARAQPVGEIGEPVFMERAGQRSARPQPPGLPPAAPSNRDRPRWHRRAPKCRPPAGPPGERRGWPGQGFHRLRPVLSGRRVRNAAAVFGSRPTSPAAAAACDRFPELSDFLWHRAAAYRTVAALSPLGRAKPNRAGMA